MTNHHALFRALVILTTTTCLSVGCKGLNGNISGDWEGSIDCGSESESESEFDVEFDLERDDKDTFTGKGTMDYPCPITDGYYEWIEICDMTFEVTAKSEGKAGEQEIEFELDDCKIHYEGATEEWDCPEDSELDWDGADSMDGDQDDCDVEFERD